RPGVRRPRRCLQPRREAAGDRWRRQHREGLGGAGLTTRPNQRPRLTGAAILVFRASTSPCRRPRQLSLGVRPRRWRRTVKAFVVRVNGKRLCTAGVGPNGVLTAIVNWVGGGPRRDAEGDFGFHVGGRI